MKEKIGNIKILMIKFIREATEETLLKLLEDTCTKLN